MRVACLAATSAFGCNAVLGIEEPITIDSGIVGSGGSGATGTGAGGGSGATGGTTIAGGAGGSAGGAGTSSGPVESGPYAWADWPMPNPAVTGLPNAQSYDLTSMTGVVTDLVTRLQWQASVDAGSYTWTGAQSYCAGLALAGGSWRVPSRIELLSIVDFTNNNPVIDPGAFPNTPTDYFWTSSPYAGDAASAWNINFRFSGGMTEKSDRAQMHRVRCVR